MLVVTEIYPAGEPKLPGVEARSLVRAIRERGHREVHWAAEESEIVPMLRRLVRAGDVLLIMGAGDIGRVAVNFLDDAEGGAND